MPLRPWTTGARTWKRVPSSSSMIRSTICCGVWRDTGVPSSGQCGHADAGEEQAEVVVDLGDGADRGAGVAAGRLLVDGDGRRQALDEVDVGLVHLAEELAGVGRQRLDVAALALGVDGVEGQRALARPGQAGEDDELVAGQLEVDALEVVFACSLHHQRVGHVERLAACCDREGEHLFGWTISPRSSAISPRSSPRSSAISPRKAVMSLWRATSDHPTGGSSSISTPASDGPSTDSSRSKSRRRS